MKKVDDIDKHLASSLKENPQKSTRVLSRSLGVSEKTVLHRIEQLSRSNLLKVTVQWDMHALGLDVAGHVYIHIGTRPMNAVAEQLAAFNHVISFSEISGWPGIHAFVVAKSVAEFVAASDDIARSIPGISIIETDMVGQVSKYDIHYGGGSVSGNWRPELNKIAPRVKIDDFDIELVHKMQTDARVSFRELGRQLDVSEQKVRSRFRKLTEAGAVAKAAVIQPFVFDYSAGALIRVKLENAGADAFCDHLKQDESVVMTMIVVGKYNVVLAMMGHSQESIASNFRDHIVDHPDVSKFSILPIINTFKYSYGLVAL